MPSVLFLKNYKTVDIKISQFIFIEATWKLIFFANIISTCSINLYDLE